MLSIRIVIAASIFEYVCMRLSGLYACVGVWSEGLSVFYEGEKRFRLVFFF